MPYRKLATAASPALIIYVLDVSASMEGRLGGKRRIDVVTDALSAALRRMVFRSTKGSRVAPRYRVAMLAYSDVVYDVLGGIKSIGEVAALGVPELLPMHTTDTARAFERVEQLLDAELPQLADCPAPLVCHMTDSQYTGDDPEPAARRVMSMAVPDGNVLIENIFLSSSFLPEPIASPMTWPGLRAESPLTGDYARKLQRISSVLPEGYRATMAESGYRLTPGALMLLPGTSLELVAMGFQMSAATPVS